MAIALNMPVVLLKNTVTKLLQKQLATNVLISKYLY